MSTPATNAPTTLGAAVGLVPSSLAALVVAFFGEDWTNAQITAVVGFAAILGTIAGIIGGQYVQRNHTEPREE